MVHIGRKGSSLGWKVADKSLQYNGAGTDLSILRILPRYQRVYESPFSISMTLY